MTALEKSRGTTIEVSSTWVRLEAGREPLLWQYQVPRTAQGNVKEQFYLAQLAGPGVVLLNSGTAFQVTPDEVRSLLERVGKTLSVSDRPIDLNTASAKAKTR